MNLTSFTWSSASRRGLKVSPGTLAHIGRIWARPPPPVVAQRQPGHVRPEVPSGESSRSLSLQDQDEIVALGEDVCVAGLYRKIQT